MKTKVIKLSDIAIDGGTQQREKIDIQIVSEYAEALQCGGKFPAITVFFDGANYWLVDGFHRYFAYKQSEINEINADIHEGTQRDAKLFSAGVNGTHGLRPTNQDKRKAVLVLIEDTEWKYWTDTAIAKHCKVTQPFVSKIRREINDIQKDIISKDIKTVLDKPLEPAQTLETENPEPDENEQIITELKDTVISLDEENTRLKDAIASNQLPTDIEIQDAAEIITNLRAQIRTLEAELNSVKQTRDSYLIENSQLKTQLTMQRNQLKKLGK